VLILSAIIISIQPRGSKAVSVGSLTEFTYYLPGVTGGITNPDDVEESVIFAPHSISTGQETSTLNSFTVPTINDYYDDITAGNYITIQSNITKWRGNILQKADVKVRAI